MCQGIPQLPQPALGVRLGVEEQVDRLPQQPHQQVAAASGPDALADQFFREGTAKHPVIGAENRVVRQAQRLDVRHGIAQQPGFVEDREDFLVRTDAVVLLARQPHAQPQRERGPRIGR